MKVLHLLSSNKFSGAENVACQIISMMGHCPECEMIYCSPDGEIRGALEERDIPFVAIGKMSVSEIKRILQEQKPDVLHAHDMGASFFAALACKTTPLISHIHNNGFDSRRLTLKAILYRLAAIRAEHIFWVSKAAKDGYIFKKGLQKKSSVLYNVIDIHALHQKAAEAECQSAYDVVYLGRLTYPKNPQRLISVLGKVIEQKPDLKAAIIGTGEMEEEIQQRIADKKLQNNVELLGFRSNPYGILKNAKVMLMTSRWEGLPMCALEAMALGVPIVSTPTDGLKELLEHGRTGYFAESDEALAENVVQLLIDRQLQQKISVNTAAKAKDINDIEQYKAALLKEYDMA